MERKAPKSINLFATGMNGDEDLAQDIIMKGDKFHYSQNLGEMTIAESAKPVLAATRGDDAKDDKKEEKKAEKKDEKKGEKKAEKKDEKKGEEKKDGEKKDDKKEDKKEDGKEEKKDAKDAKDEKKDGEEEEKKEEEKKQSPGEATWEEHNDCKENEWEAGDGNCAFEAEDLKIGRHNLVQVEGP